MLKVFVCSYFFIFLTIPWKDCVCVFTFQNTLNCFPFSHSSFVWCFDEKKKRKIENDFLGSTKNEFRTTKMKLLIEYVFGCECGRVSISLTYIFYIIFIFRFFFLFFFQNDKTLTSSVTSYGKWANDIRLLHSFQWKWLNTSIASVQCTR